ncbi:hypothetical protein AVEN_163911-1 [Araneus ventricosus]|uniref:Uncharacterized protein n=1 Tax=Araneus ventricosus TaxID=182803 RepID=A0A4Y2PIJ9_ARAVE|nr:hypothetical protein AVEN_163911-1 [Araneus ventricosus]
MASFITMEVLVLICCWVISFAIAEDVTNSLKTREETGRAGRLYNPDKWNFQKLDYKGHSSNVKSHSDLNDSHDSVRHEILSEMDDFLPDRSVDDKYSYSPGGFYVPQERKAKLNYHFEEVVDNDQNQNKGLIPNEKSSMDLTSKILTGSNQIETETEIIQRPTFLSVLKKAFLNPLVIISVAAVPLAFIIEMMFPYVMNLFSGNMLPSVATTIASGFARSLDGDTALHVEQVLDVINEFGVKALEDPKCLQRFLCQGAKSQSESHSEGSWSIQKIVQKLEKSVDDEMLDKYGLKSLFNSVQNGNCESLVCKGSPAYNQDVPLFEKLYLLGAKVFNLTEIVH